MERNSGLRQVKATPDELQELTFDRMVAEENGYLIVYPSNSSEADVYFDNEQLVVASGPLIEPRHYYPYGLTMEAISSNTLTGTNYPESSVRFNGKELQSAEFKDGTGLEMYDFGAITYDQQIGRWLQIDKLATKMRRF